MRGKKSVVARASCAVVAGLALSVPMTKSANAALTATTWVGTAADGQWTGPTNWNNGVPATNYNAIFNGSTPTSISLGGAGQALNSLNISGASSYTIGTTSGDTLNFDNNGQITFAGTVGSTISANMNVGTTGNVVVVNNSTNGSILTFSGSVTGNAGVQYKQAAASTTGGILIMGSSNYSGTTNLSASSTTPIYVGSDTAFGSGTLLFNNASNPGFQAVGGDRNLANPVLLGSGFAIVSNAVPHNLTFSGPISMSTTSRTLTFGNFGTVCYLGASPNSSTITTSTTTALNLAIDPSNTSSGNNPAIVVLNDKIVDPATPPAATSTITYSPVNSNTPQGILIINGASTYANNTIFSQQNTSGAAALQVELGVDSVMNGNAIVSGPFGKGQVTMQNSTSPTVLIPFGADRTIANPFSDAAAGFGVATAPLSGTTVNVDPTGVPHNLTLTGAITIGNSSAGRTITNNMANSALLNLGDPNNPNIITIVNTLQFQSQAATSGTNMIYDQLTGSSGLKVIGSTVKLFNNTNNYAGSTVLTNGKTYALNTSGSATGTGPVTVTGSGALGSGGTLGGTGSISGLLTVSSTTSGSRGGMIAPGAAGAVAGTFHAGSMVMDPLGRYLFDYVQADDTAGSGINDLISGSGTLDLTNLSAAAQFDLALNPLDNSGGVNSYIMADFAQGILSGGNAIPNGTEVTSLFSISGSYPSDAHVFVQQGLEGGASQALVLVPEPTSLGIIALGAMPLLRRRRRD